MQVEERKVQSNVILVFLKATQNNLIVICVFLYICVWMQRKKHSKTSDGQRYLVYSYYKS